MRKCIGTESAIIKSFSGIRMRLPDDEVIMLTAEYRKTPACQKRCAELRDRLIISHIPLVFNYVSRCSFRGYTRYEYMSELLYGLVDGVRKAHSHLYDDNITPYLKSCLRDQACKYKAKLPLIPIPRKEYQLGVRPPKLQMLQCHHVRSLESRIDTLEFIYKNSRNEIETAIIDGLVAGDSYQEIADTMQVTRQYISAIAAQMRDRMSRRKRLVEEHDGSYKMVSV